MVAAELAPYAQETEAAESVAGLSKSLRQLGHEVTVAMPRYPSLEAGGLQLARRLTPLGLRGGSEVMVFDGQLPTGVKLVVFDAPVFSERPGIFTSPDGKPLEDSAARFGLLAQSAAALVRQRIQQGHALDLVHLHDWPAALVPLLSRLEPGPDLPTVLTLHDGPDHGRFAAKELAAFGLTKEAAQGEGLLERGKFCVVRAGIAHASCITAASPTFASTLTDAETGGPVARAAEEYGKSIIGILDGVDYATCNPAVDPLLASRYDAEEPGGKARSKTALLRQLGLEVDPSRPLLAVVGGVGHDTGSDLVAASLSGLMKLDETVVLAGMRAGAALVQRSERIAKRFPTRFFNESAPSEAFFHQLLAAADFALIASRRAPSGLTAMKSQRYGAVPIVIATGAHRDCVVDADANLSTGTGFVFEEPQHTALVGAVQRAVASYAKPEFERLRRRIMRIDLSWDRAARRYAQLYKQALAAKS